jgi:hypothetical protein
MATTSLWPIHNTGGRGVRVLDPSYSGKLAVLPKANGLLLEVED